MALVVESARSLNVSRARDFYRMYLAAFAELQVRAAARHVLTKEEFVAEMVDEAVTKYVAVLDGAAIGLSTMTDDLTSVPWISSEFFAARYPELSAQGRVLYLGFVLVEPAHQGGPALSELLQAMGRRAVARRAVVAYDICAYNNDSRDFAAATHRMMSSMADVDHAVVDVQTYYAMSFERAGDGGPPES